MKRLVNIPETSDTNLREIFERARMTPRLPDEVRARARGRALAFLTAAAATSPPIATRHIRSVRLAFAVSLTLAAGAAGAAVGAIATLRGRAPRASVPATLRISDVTGPLLVCEADSSEARPVLRAKPILSEKARARPSSSARDTYSSGLRLLQRAQVAYVGADFFNALALVMEHERRFPDAELAEERDALRVSSLWKAGRAAEARDAVEAFAHRFPHSVLLPTLRLILKPE